MVKNTGKTEENTEKSFPTYKKTGGMAMFLKKKAVMVAKSPGKKPIVEEK